MKLPPRMFFSSSEVAAHWGCSPTDIVEWAATERLQLMTATALVQTNEGPLSGLIELHAADLMPMFRRDETGPNKVRVFRARSPGKTAWASIVTRKGFIVARSDLRISAREKARFEDENGLVRRANIEQPNQKYDWGAVTVAVIKWMKEEGVPNTQAEFIREVQEWFAQHDRRGEVPDERTIRRRLSPVWRVLRGEDYEATPIAGDQRH